MASRDEILTRLRENQFEAALPGVPRFDAPVGDVTKAFSDAVQSAAGRVVQARRQEIASRVQELYPSAATILSSDVAVRGTVEIRQEHPTEIRALVETVDLFVCPGQVGVAENGAVWVSDASLPARAALFATQHLALIIDSRTIVWNLHQAYQQIDIAKEGFGLFVCGPSKTADIEQSLVIGAHGPRSLVVFVTSDN